MPQRNVATNFTFEQQRVEINELAADFWTQKGTVDTAAGTYLLRDGTNAFTGATLAVPAAFTINSNSGAGTVTINGNLQVDGTTTTLNSTTLEISDKNLVIAKGGANDAAVDGAGITIDSATDITWNFVDADDAWVSSIGVKAVGGFTGNLTGTASGNAVLTGATNNQICTVTGANAIQGEVGLTFDGTSLNLPTINTWITGGGHSVLQVDATKTYFYGGTGGAQYRKADNSAPLISVLDDGNLGIGTDNPGELLEIKKTSGTTLFKASVGGNSTIGLEIEKTGSTTQSWRIADGQTVNGKLEFYDVTDSATRMCIDGDGNVGIGITNPGEKLSVNGKIEARSGNWFIARSGDNSNYAYIRNPSASSAELSLFAGSERIKITNSTTTMTGGLIQNDDSAETAFASKSLPSGDSGYYIRNGNGGTGTYTSLGLIASSTGASSDQSASLVVKCTGSGLSPEVYLTQRDGSNSQRNTLAINTLGDATFIGDVSDHKGNLRNLPRNEPGAAYTALATDAGKFISTNADVTFNGGIWSTGQAITIYNYGGSAINIVSGSNSFLMHWTDGTTATTGTRILASRGTCTLLCVQGPNTFVISGALT